MQARHSSSGAVNDASGMIRDIIPHSLVKVNDASGMIRDIIPHPCLTQ